MLKRRFRKSKDAKGPKTKRSEAKRPIILYYTLTNNILQILTIIAVKQNLAKSCIKYMQAKCNKNLDVDI